MGTLSCVEWLGWDCSGGAALVVLKCPPTSRGSHTREGGYPVRRGSIDLHSLAPLEYWIIRLSRMMTAGR